MPELGQLEIIRPDWDVPRNIIACTTTRQGGYSQGAWASFNLASHVEDDPVAVSQNRSLLKSFLQLPSEPVWLEQVHGCDVVIADNVNDVPACDASFTQQPDVVCAVLTADCLPLLLCSEEGDQVAAVHAGWRGLAAGVIEQTVSSMNCPGEKILAWLGPAIGPDAFEVGAEVREIFTGFDSQASSAFKEHGNKWLCDIYQLARQRLENLGISQISGGDYCTYHDSGRFYSYRRDGETGRMASLICILDMDQINSA